MPHTITAFLAITRTLRRIAQHFGAPAPLCTCTTCRDIIATRNR